MDPRTRLLLGVSMLALTGVIGTAQQAQAQTNTADFTTVGATNSNTVTGTATINSVVISAGEAGDRVSISAAGAAASGTITQSVTGTTGAQIPTNQVSGGAASASNTGSVQSTGTVTTTTQIQGGWNNSVSIGAGGAQATLGISQGADNTTAATPFLANTILFNNPGAPRVTATNTAGVSAGGVFSGAANISGTGDSGTSMGNVIAVQAVGAGANGNITQTILGDGVAALSGANTINATGYSASNLNAATGGVTSNGSFHTDLGIGGGLGNAASISAQGAQAGATLSQAIVGSTVSPTTVSTLGANTLTIGLSGVASLNSASVVTSNGTFAGGTTITNGIGNSISSLGQGAVSNLGISQLVSGSGSAVTGTNTVTSTGSITATNSGTTGANPANVTASGSFTGTSTIANGIGSSISVGAQGARTNASITQVTNQVLANPGTANFGTNGISVTGAGGLSATNTGPANVLATGTFDNAATAATISGGVGNGVGVSAAGAVSTSGISQTVSSGTATFANNTIGITVQTANNSGVSAGNSAAISANGTFSGPASIGGAGGTTPVGNSITVAAIGAQSTSTIAQTLTDNTTAAATNFGTNSITGGNVSATNGSTFAPVAATGSFQSVSIGGQPTGGLGNSIGVQAVGAAAGVGVTSVIVH